MSKPETTVQNPLLLADFPDNSVICVDGVYYMTATSMYYMPGIPVLRSYDLAHWDVVAYVYDTFLENDGHTLQNEKNIYGKGSWATCLRYHNNWFYVCFNSNDAQDTFVYRTRDIINGPWEYARLGKRHHDPSLLFDDDGRTYIIYGNGTIYIRELQPDAMAILPGGVDRVLVDTPKVEGLNCEGSHMHKINGVYYLMVIQWPQAARRIQWCYRCKELLGRYEGKVVLNDDLGYQNQGVAQGGLFMGAGGEWYAMLFQDRSAVGRCPVLLPVIWRDGWPELGVDGRAPLTFSVPYKKHISAPVVANDEFDYPKNSLQLAWQWNHNPCAEGWSVTERPGHLRLKAITVSPCLEQARNTLTQRTISPISCFWVKLDASALRDGDRAGLAAFQHLFGYAGVWMVGGQKSLVFCRGEGNREEMVCCQPLKGDTVCLKLTFDYTDGTDFVRFYYSYDDGACWNEIGEPLHMEYRLAHFVGYRAAVFAYATKQPGGVADFGYFRCSYPKQ